MSVDSDTNWNLDYTVDPAGNEIDLYTVIRHEISHVLGMGLADSWDNLISNNQFGGTAAVAEYGSPVPTTADGGHWASGTTSTVFAVGDSQDALMTPTVAWGNRKYLTDIDAAGLDDIGWDINYPPPPPSWIQAAGGLFSTESNWSIGTKPLPTDPVEFHLANTYTVTFDANETSPSVLIDAGTVSFDLASHTYTVENLTLSGSSTDLNIANQHMMSGRVQ